MTKCAFVLFILLIQSPSTHANDLLNSYIKNFNEIAKKTGVPNKNTHCNEDYEIAKTTMLYSEFNKKNVEVSILSEERAKEVFKKLKDDEDNSFNYPYDGCLARAHQMALMMDEMNIISGKAFIEGPLHFKIGLLERDWLYHTASLIAVRKNGKIIPTIIDPALFDRPVSFEEWKNYVSKNPQSKMKSSYFTQRFNYDFQDANDDLKDYREDTLEDAKKMNREHARRGELFKTLPKSEVQKYLNDIFK